ncbi:MAG: alpha/beta hydrolase [Armatimonadetes bacterium]|nr:alpha/beta hydrolase [Armatimonadota bacterium]
MMVNRATALKRVFNFVCAPLILSTIFVLSGAFSLSPACLAQQPVQRWPQASPVNKRGEQHRDLAYVANGHSRQKLDLYLPAGSAAPLPLIIWIHGGGWRNGSKELCLPLRSGFLERGYAIASIGYRLSGDAPFPAQIEDCKAAVRWLRAHARDYNLDSRRFGVWGSSAGGHLAALLGTSGDVKKFDKGAHLDVSSRVQAVCDFYGPSDFIKFVATPGYERHGERSSPESLLLGGAVLENREQAANASPVTYVSRDDPPFLIIHGDQDRTVPPAQSVLLQSALQDAGVSSTHHLIKGAGHGGPAFSAPDTVNKVDAFFRQHVGMDVNTSTASQTAAPGLGSETDANSAFSDIAFTDFRHNGHSWTCLVEGKPMSGILVMPEGEGPFPAILISHGMGATAERFAGSKAREFAKWGFASIATDYTHANSGSRPAAGLRRNQNNDFGASNENIRRARVCLSILRSLPDVNKARLYAYGNSMGAFLTIGLAAAEPKVLAAAALTAGGVIEVEGFPAPSTAQAAQIRTPFLILHGSNDTTVPPQRSALLQSILQENKVRNERHVWEDVGHNLHAEESAEIYRMIRAWFTKDHS